MTVNLITGEVAHPTTGIPIGQWEAEILDEVEEYLRLQERHRNAPILLWEWDKIGSEPGIPKSREPGNKE